MAVCCVLTLYSSFYFYYRLPGSDAHYFRGMTENFIRTENLDPSRATHFYYQWPSFFILADIATLTSGLELATYEFLLFAIIGFLLATALYVYASKAYAHGDIFAVVAFFVVMFYFLNYQTVPFSLALGLLFLLFMLEVREKSSSGISTMLVLYVGISIMHAFVPLFFVLYLLMRSIVSRSRHYLNLTILTLMVYFSVQFTLAQYSFSDIVISITGAPTEYSRIVSSTLTPVTVLTDVVAQALSRTVTIAFGVICFAGFFLIVIRRKMREMDKAIFLTGALYSGLGLIVYTLGSRALPIIFVPVSLGILYVYQSKFRPYLKCLILIFLILSVFISIHISFGGIPVTFQTREAQTTADFMIDKYDWNLNTLILSDVGQNAYLDPQVSGHALVQNVASEAFSSQGVETYDCIIYDVGFERTLQSSGISAEKTSQEVQSEFNLIYNLGSSYIAIKP